MLVASDLNIRTNRIESGEKTSGDEIGRPPLLADALMLDIEQTAPIAARILD
jgi:hypothetical protein